MEILMQVFQSISKNFLTQPAYFIGMLSFVGAILLKKRWYEALSSFIKTAIGFLILTAGSGGLVQTFRPIIESIGLKFDRKIGVVDTYFMLGQLYGDTGVYSIPGAVMWTMTAFIVSFLVNMILVYFNKYTKCRTVYTTGHVLQGYSTMWTFMIYLVAPETRNFTYTFLVGLFIGIFTSIASNLTVEATKDLTDNAGFAVAHQQMFGILITDKFAGKIGSKDEDIAKIKLPGALSIFSDNIVSIAVLLTLFIGPIMFMVGPETLAKVDAGFKNSGMALWAYVLKSCLMFSVYMFILRQGVALFVSELTAAFEGIKQKFLKNSIPAVDCAVTFNYAHPNVTMFGFVFGFLGQIVAMALLLIFNSPLFLVPGFIPLFFDNATLAVFANNKGGRKAAMLIPFISGFIQVMVSLVMLLWIHGVSGYELVAWPAMGDNNLMIAPLLYLTYLFNPYVVLALFTVLLIFIHIRHYKKHKEGYYDNI